HWPARASPQSSGESILATIGRRRKLTALRPDRARQFALVSQSFRARHRVRGSHPTPIAGGGRCVSRNRQEGKSNLGRMLIEIEIHHHADLPRVIRATRI